MVHTAQTLAYITNKLKLLQNNDNIHPRQSNNIDPFKHVMTERYIMELYLLLANDSNFENKGTLER